MAGVKVWTSGEVLSAADLNGNFNKLPFGFAAGSSGSTTGALATNAQTTVSVTFPAGRFTVAPIVSAWTGSQRYVAVATTIAAGSATITIRNVSDATGTDVSVFYHAVQMTSGTAAG